jgi:hypothetical protein
LLNPAEEAKGTSEKRLILRAQMIVEDLCRFWREWWEWKSGVDLLRYTPPVVSCYEAGYDGFWLHRLLTARDTVDYQ